MTRETKIGLLVGLAFIIVIGILLSDHINTTTDPIRANATNIFDTVSSSVDAPDSRQKGQTDIVVPPQPVMPHNAIPTTPRGDRHLDSGDTVINVSPGKDPSTMDLPPRRNQGPVVLVQPSGPANPDPVVEQNPTPASPQETASVFSGQDTTTTDLQREAMKSNEQIVSPNGSPVGISPGPSVKTVVIATVGKQVKAEEGDTVSKLASRYMGANSRANREAIIKANPSMTPDGHLVFSGRTYTIPQPVATSAPVAIAPTATPAPTKPTPVPAVAQKPAAPESGNYYTVKENETLWKIAAAQLGAGIRYSEIKELNADTLKGGDQVRTGMRLKMPNKSVASAN